MNNKLKPALFGGIVVGLLSAIPFVNSCCCLWAIAGGALAVYLYVKGSQTPVSTGEGAMLGALAGAVGTVIYIILGIPLAFMFRNSMMGMFSGMMGSMPPEQQAAVQQAMESSGSASSVILNSLMVICLLVVFSTIGGLIGVPLFEKRKDGGLTPPPPPPDFGGQAGGGFGGPTGGGFGSNP
jgi:hypothetical protein